MLSEKENTNCEIQNTKNVFFTADEDSVIKRHKDPITSKYDLKAIHHELPHRTERQIRDRIRYIKDKIKNPSPIIKNFKQSQIIQQNNPMKGKHFQKEDDDHLRRAFDPITYKIDPVELSNVSKILGRSESQLIYRINHIQKKEMMARAVEKQTQMELERMRAQIQAQNNHQSQNESQKPFPIPLISNNKPQFSPEELPPVYEELHSTHTFFDSQMPEAFSPFNDEGLISSNTFIDSQIPEAFSPVDNEGLDLTDTFIDSQIPEAFSPVDNEGFNSTNTFIDSQMQQVFSPFNDEELNSTQTQPEEKMFDLS